MRFIARSYINLNNLIEAEFWYKLAIKESPNSREGYVELGMLYYSEKRWLDSIFYLLKSLTIKEKDLIYINEVFCWDSTIDDLLSINYYNIELYDLALFHINKALKYDKNNKRLLDNKKLIESKI